MPSVILSDLGGVVVQIDPHRCHRCWSGLSPLEPGEISDRLYPDQVYEAFERGQVSGQQYLEHVRRQLKTDAGDEALQRCFNDIYLGIDEDSLSLLSMEQDRGFRLAALTNTNEMHYDRWWPQYREHLQVFEQIYLSFELGSRKPEPGCFEAILKAEEVGPEEVVFIDDVVGHVEAARAVGLTAIHYTSAEQLSTDLEPVLRGSTGTGR